jgi:hypothetical protein
MGQKMKKLEDFIDQNRQRFDEALPGRFHEENFIALLEQQKVSKQAERFSKINLWLKSAAALLVLMGFGAAIYSVTGNRTGVEQNTEARLPEDVIRMEQYYNTMALEKIERIETLAGTGPEGEMVKKQLTAEIQNLTGMSEELKKEYIRGNGDERLIDAIRNNYRILSGLLDKVTNQLANPGQESGNLSPDNPIKQPNHENIKA